MAAGLQIHGTGVLTFFHQLYVSGTTGSGRLMRSKPQSGTLIAGN
jgi:hypothetical protein